DYGIAVARLELGEFGAARELFRNLNREHPHVIHFHTGLAAAELGAGDTPGAIALLPHAIALVPRNVPHPIRYPDMMLDREPKRAHQVLLDLFNNGRPTPDQVRLIARAASAAGDTADAHYYMAEFHLMKGDLRVAIDQLRLALTIPGLDGVQRARFT